MFGPQPVTSGKLANPWARRMHNISFGRPNQGEMAACSVKRITALLRFVMLSKSIATLLHKVNGWFCLPSPYATKSFLMVHTIKVSISIEKVCEKKFVKLKHF